MINKHSVIKVTAFLFVAMSAPIFAAEPVNNKPSVALVDLMKMSGPLDKGMTFDVNDSGKVIPVTIENDSLKVIAHGYFPGRVDQFGNQEDAGMLHPFIERQTEVCTHINAPFGYELSRDIRKHSSKLAVARGKRGAVNAGTTLTQHEAEQIVFMTEIESKREIRRTKLGKFVFGASFLGAIGVGAAVYNQCTKKP